MEDWGEEDVEMVMGCLEVDFLASFCGLRFVHQVSVILFH